MFWARKLKDKFSVSYQISTSIKSFDSKPTHFYKSEICKLPLYICICCNIRSLTWYADSKLSAKPGGQIYNQYDTCPTWSQQSKLGQSEPCPIYFLMFLKHFIDEILRVQPSFEKLLWSDSEQFAVNLQLSPLEAPSPQWNQFVLTSFHI